MSNEVTAQPVSSEKEHSQPQATDNVQTNLENISLTQDQLKQVKRSLGNIVDTMDQNRSMVSRAARFWGELPLWEKVLGGLLLSGPTLAAGLIAHIGALLAISGATVVTYTASGIVLNDHHNLSKKFTDRLKKGIFDIADILELVIAALDRICQNLAQEVVRFRTENNRLTNKLDDLSRQVDSLTHQVEALAATEQLLKKSKDELEIITNNLKQKVSDNDELLKEHQAELTQVKKDYEQSKIQLGQKITELATVKTEMGLEIEKAKKVAATLQGTVQALSGTVIEDEKSRKEFQTKLENFLKDKEGSFDKIAARISEAERELAQIKAELEQSNARYQELLDRQERQVERLEKAGNTPTSGTTTGFSSLLRDFGLYSDESRTNPEAGQAQNLVYN